MLKVNDALGEWRTYLISESDYAELLREDGFTSRLDIDSTALASTIDD